MTYLTQEHRFTFNNHQNQETISYHYVCSSVKLKCLDVFLWHEYTHGNIHTPLIYCVVDHALL